MKLSQQEKRIQQTFDKLEGNNPKRPKVAEPDQSSAKQMRKYIYIYKKEARLILQSGIYICFYQYFGGLKIE